MACRRSVSQRDEWRSTVMRAASDVAERVMPPPPRTWRSGTMRMLDAVVTPGTAANVAVSLAVTALVIPRIPRIPNRALAVAAGFAAGSILRG